MLPIATKYDASMSVWMSPFGGYDPSASRRKQLNASKPADERLETNSAGFALGGTRYGQHFRDVVFDMIDNHGVRGFKFDGIGGGLYQTGPNQNYITDYEALLDLAGDMRAHNDQIWINATVGTWGSPYWLWYVDSIWRDGNDAISDSSGDWASYAGSSTDRYVSYRDQESYKNHTLRNRLFPTTNLMNHGLIFAPRGYTQHFNFDTDLNKPEVLADAKKAIKAYFGLGLGLQELYVQSSFVDPAKVGDAANAFWDTLAANAKWARSNEQLLTDSRLIGAAPVSGGVYGSAAWSASGNGKGVLMLRNPSASEKVFTVDPATAFELPTGVSSRYTFTERDGAAATFTADALRPYTFKLQPFEVLVFEAAASNAAITPSVAVPEVAPNLLPTTGWTATASTQETSGEDGRASNVLDNNPSTIWHSAYTTASGGRKPFPHTLTIDTAAPVTFNRIDYVPRTNGSNGIVTSYDYQVSEDGTTFRSISAGTWSQGGIKRVEFAEPVTTRYVRLVSKAGASGFSTAADLLFFAPTTAQDDAAPSGPPATIVPLSDAYPNQLLLGDGLTARQGRTLELPDLPTGWSHISLSAGAKRIDLGWVKPDAGKFSATVTAAHPRPGVATDEVYRGERRLISSYLRSRSPAPRSLQGGTKTDFQQVTHIDDSARKSTW